RQAQQEKVKERRAERPKLMDGVKRWRWWAVFILGALIGSQFACGGGNDSTKANHEALVSRIAFGSCANQTAPQPIWDAIIKFDPQVFIWMGDNIYGDIKRPSKMFGKERTIGPWKNVPRFVPTSQDEMNFKYHIIKNHPAYSRLRHNLNTKIIGTWDDHDYGLNDAGKEFPAKVSNQRLLLDFLDEPLDSPRRMQAGIYTSYTFGPVGRQIKIILLDTRYHRDPLSSDGTILGSTQWTWLEKELNGPSSAITIIVSSIQVISNLSATTGPLFYMESWGRFPKERDRLFQLIADSKRNGVFFISGDVHFGEITRYDCDVGYALYDITSSQPNFGAIEIDWDATPVALKIEVRDTDGIPAIGVNISLSELQAQSVNSAATLRVGEHQKHCSLEVDLPWIVRYRLTILFYFSVAVLLFALVGLNFAAAVVFRLFLRKCKLD
ncbi:hypothetical protein CICLE_v10003552mg, partial [Citrus x clementina]